ncbi:hemolysin XhlA [Parageobacillus genomosp. 1]|uniref:Hemolysin XhlA n=2 Tax=Parageobacillus genomosp. 1 TaxID=1295642 RepID=A0ABC9VA44_9BACL|nr:hemolysin XhlA [Parageobacillus genomosp. 1]
MEQRVAKLEADMVDVKTRLAVAESNIKDMREDVADIKNDTKWIRRTLTGAIISAVCTGVIGGAIAIFYAMLQK